jgi:tetratricopeptide (TPR) repeat protein
LNLNNITYLLNNPQAVDENQTMALENILQQYPYFQGIRALYLKGLYNLNSYRYNFELKKTAAHTTDRTILFDFIISDSFKIVNTEIIEKQQKEVNDIIVDDFIIVPNFAFSMNEPIEKFKESNEISLEPLTEIEEKLEINKPLQFDLEEKHSFSEWLQLAKFSPIDREKEEVTEEITEEKKKKLDIIDKFIESNPKIGPIKETIKNADITERSSEEPTHLMTETLARIYLEQKKYKKAIQAYDILILKYPEKSIFFANRIKDIKELQQNN